MGTSEGARKGWTEESRRKRAEAMRRKWEDPEYRARRAAKEQDPQTKANRSAGSAQANADPEKRRKHSERMTEKWANDAEFRERHSAGLRKAAEDPEYRRKRSESSKRAWEVSPEAFVNSLRATAEDAHSAEGRERRRATMKRLWEDGIIVEAAMKSIAARPPGKHERMVMDALREMEQRFTHHLIIDRWEIDVYAIDHQLDIEVDGYHHTLPGRDLHDQRRDKALDNLGVRVLRITEEEIDKGTFVAKLREALGMT